MKVTQQEIIDLLQNSDCYGAAEMRKRIIEHGERIIEHGIELPYVMMTDDELHRIWIAAEALNATETMRLLENRVLARLGVVPMPPIHADIQALIEHMDSDPLQEKNALITQREWQLLKSALGVAPTSQEPFAWIDPQSLTNFKNGVSTKEWVWNMPNLSKLYGDKDTGLIRIYTTPQAPTLGQAKNICEQHGFAVVPFSTLNHWRTLVDDNPKDLAPRIEEYTKDKP